MAVGKAIDNALSKYGHDYRRGFRPTVGALTAFAEDELSRELEDIDLVVAPAEYERLRAQISGVLQAFRKTEVFGMARPRSRLVLIDEQVGVYVQPDYWDGKRRFYEMKSYRAIPPPTEVALQVRLFQLGFPGFEAILLCVDRHAVPPASSQTVMPPLSRDTTAETLSRALGAAPAHGREAVLEYIDVPVVRYSTKVV